MTTKDNDNLASVLERINLLMQAPLPVVSSGDEEGDIPILTEIYMVGIAPLKVKADRQAQMDALLMEMLPFIHKEVKKAVLHESVKLEKALASQLESDLLKVLRERLLTSD